MNSTTFATLVAVAADYFYLALRATEDLDSFLQAVRGGMREAAVAAVAECVERFDREVASQVPGSWVLRGRPSRTVVAMFGRITYARSLYRDEHGRNRYPTDEILGIPKRRRLTTDVFLWLVARAARVSFRRTARDFAEVSGVQMPYGIKRAWPRRIGRRIWLPQCWPWMGLMLAGMWRSLTRRLRRE